MGTWGLGDMGSRGHSTEDIHTPLGLDMGTWGLGDMGSRGHSTEDIHTFRVRQGGMGFRGHGV